MTVPTDYVRSPSEHYFLFSFMLRRRPDLSDELKASCVNGLEAVKVTTPIEKMKKRIEVQLAA